MLDALPMSICSWDFRVLAANGAGVAGLLTMNHWTEQGTIRAGDVEYTVRKHGPGSGRWTLEHGGSVYAEAYKPSVFVRRFELQTGGGRCVLEAESAFGRSFRLLTESGGPLAMFRPVHAFTRRATIDARPDLPELDQLFAFWIVALTWRRAAKNNSGAAGGGG